jgi:hypothetical protein
VIVQPCGVLLTTARRTMGDGTETDVSEVHVYYLMCAATIGALHNHMVKPV